MSRLLSSLSSTSHPCASNYVPAQCSPIHASFDEKQRSRNRHRRLSVSATTSTTKMDEVATSNREQDIQEARPADPKRGSDEQSRAKSTKQTSNAYVPQTIPVIPASELPTHFNLLLSSNTGASLQATFCNVADSLIGTYLDPPQLKTSVDPKVQLSGNFAPVPECPPVKCLDVEGALPLDLNGVYLRNGPNAARINANGGHHMFDGDGMLHSVRLKDGEATYCCRYVRTSRFTQEEEAGRPLFPRFFGGFQGAAGLARGAMSFVRAALGLVDMRRGWGLANTSVGYFNGEVLAMSEEDMPYVVRVKEDGDVETVGKLSLPGGGGAGAKLNMCAHPKLDPTTGEMFAFSFSPGVPPFTYFRVSADGVRSPDVAIPLLDLPMIHDFCITKRFVIFPDNQFVIRPLEFLKGSDIPIVCDKSKTPRFCLLPRYATPGAARAQWFEVPECNCYHYLNAWEEGNEVVMITPVLSPPELFLEIPAYRTMLTLTEVRLDTRTGAARQRRMCAGNFEFGTFNHRYTGRKNRYAYFASGFYPRLGGVVKVDFRGKTEEESVVARREYGENWYGSEPFFVARSSSSPSQLDDRDDEDDGYLVAFVHNEATGASEFQIMDARSPSLQLVASVKLPSRVPYGFHGYFVTQEQIANARP